MMVFKKQVIIISSQEGVSKSYGGSYCGSQEEITDNRDLIGTEDMSDSIPVMVEELCIHGSLKVSFILQLGT